jgi:hypothetical protein
MAFREIQYSLQFDLEDAHMGFTLPGIKSLLTSFTWSPKAFFKYAKPGSFRTPHAMLRCCDPALLIPEEIIRTRVSILA